MKSNIEKIGGSIEIFTQAGAGTKFILQIPLSLAVIDGMIVAAGNCKFVIPLFQVQETISVGKLKVYRNHVEQRWYFELRNQIVPIYDLGDTLNKTVKTESSLKNGTVLITNVDERPIAIRVEEILKIQQVVIKPLQNGLPQRNGWLGTCVLGDGMPTLIVSPTELFAKSKAVATALSQTGVAS